MGKIPYYSLLIGEIAFLLSCFLFVPTVLADTSRTIDTSSDRGFFGEAVNDFFGINVASAGDVNGDGYPDILIGAYHNSAAGTNAGRAYVYFGGPGVDSAPDLIMTGEAAGDTFGQEVAAGDFNHDGYSDIVIGALRNDAGGADAGRVYIYFGGSNMDATADLVITGGQAIT
jgi:hypothetical protein